jgi:hypothetical protein
LLKQLEVLPATICSTMANNTQGRVDQERQELGQEFAWACVAPYKPLFISTTAGTRFTTSSWLVKSEANQQQHDKHQKESLCSSTHNSSRDAA